MNFSSGKRGSTPDSSRSVICSPFERNSTVDVRAYVTSGPSTASRSGVKPSVKSPEPMWNEIGSPVSVAMFHSGSQCLSPRNGSPCDCGSPVKRMPRMPRCATRSISLTDASMSQNGIEALATKRSGAAEIQSIWKSFQARTHSSISSGSLSCRKRCEAKPATFGYSTCAYTPVSSISFSRSCTSNEAGCAAS